MDFQLGDSDGSSHHHRPLVAGVSATAPFVNRPPSPPYIHIPAFTNEGPGPGSMSLMPSFDYADSTQLTQEDLAIITRNRNQTATERATSWKYESRRQAQPILDFLYLGPSSIARDKDFLRREGITMLLAARDSRLAHARLLSVEKTAQALGLHADYIDVSDRQELIRAFPMAVQKINSHLLDVYRSQAVVVGPSSSAGGDGSQQQHQQPQQQRAPDGQILIDGANFKRGKVLVFCETGNDRSAAIVAAYMMTVFAVDIVKALQFIGLQRFCANFDDETKFLLKSYQDILEAKRVVNSAANQASAGAGGHAGPGFPPHASAAAAASQAQGGFTAHTSGSGSGSGSGGGSRHGKRGFDDSMMEDEDEEMVAPDQDRFAGRTAFTPFVQHVARRP